MSRCETCVHWETAEAADSDWWGSRAKGDSPLTDSAKWGWCTKIAGGFDADPEASVIAFTMDASQYYSLLHCRADFGCVLHQEAV